MMEDAKNALRVLGGRVSGIYPIPVPDMEHQLVVVDKVRATPEAYPRTAGTPSKKPL